MPTQTHTHWVMSPLPHGIRQPEHARYLHLLQGNMLQKILSENTFIMLQHTVYMVYQERKCFVRCGRETVECSVQQKKQDMMDAEIRALESIKDMGRAALTDLASLAEFVNKYLPQQ